MKLPTVMVPFNFKSDGCTFPGILKIFKPILGAYKYRDYCREHDFLRRHGVLPAEISDLILRERIASTGTTGKIRSIFYWIFVRITYQFYGNGDEDYIEKGWENYYSHYRDWNYG